MAGLLLLASRAPAQSPGADPYKTVVVTVPSPSLGYTYTPYVVRTPLDGVAEIMRAEGDYLIKRQEANLLRLQVRDKRLETRRKELEHWKWEREFRQAAMLAEQENYRKGQVEYNSRFPAPAEIYTAAPLNSLCDDLKQRPELPGGSTPVEAEWLANVHVTASGRGNIGLLKGDKILWPRLLLRDGYADERGTIEDLLTRGKKLALAHQRNQEEMSKVLDDLEAAVRACQARLDQEIASANDPDCNPRHQIELMKFLREVINATFILRKPDAAVYFVPLQGKTVAELVAHMNSKGLSFAPATVGCERYYIALHRALAKEVTRVKNAETPSSKP